MIKFSTNGKKECTVVYCKVDFGTTKPSDKVEFNFRWETNDPHYAYLLANHFQKKLQEEIRKAHRKAYEIGYKDGKNKQRKKNSFDGYFGGDYPAY